MGAEALLNLCKEYNIMLELKLVKLVKLKEGRLRYKIVNILNCLNEIIEVMINKLQRIISL